MTKKNIVFIACTGVGHINRGYESFTRECFTVLRHESDFEIYLLKGAGPSENHEITINCLKRNSSFSELISRLLRKEPYVIEQMTFLLSMIPYIIRYKPAVIFYSDFKLGTYLWHLRSFFNFKYKLLFSNGAPNGPPFKTEDHIQQLLPMYVEEAVLGGTAVNKQTLLPYAINIDLKESSKKSDQIWVLRDKIRLPQNKKIIISVGAVNVIHKRMDYVVEEFANLDQDIYFLVILGQIGNDSKGIISLAQEKLRPQSYLIKQVDGSEVANYMAASDYFLLASLNEGLPRVLPEAMSNGLLPIVHNYLVTKQTLHSYGVFRDLTKSNILKSALLEVDSKQIPKREIIKYSYDNYSWDKLKSKYSDMICKLLE